MVVGTHARWFCFLLVPELLTSEWDASLGAACPWQGSEVAFWSVSISSEISVVGIDCSDAQRLHDKQPGWRKSYPG